MTRAQLGVRARVVGVAVAVGVLAGCGVVGGDGAGGYHLTAFFESAVGLYPHGDVTIMGVDIGTVDAVEIEDTHVRIEMTIDRGVPLPADVQATIEPQQLIGERNVVLFPAWTEAMAVAGEGRAADGDIIPIERTTTPIEPDEGLEAFNSLARSLDPEVVGDFVTDSAAVLDGRGATFGAAIDQAASLSDTFARTDEQLVRAADHLHTLASAVNSRDDQLARLVAAFAGATEVLASEREGIAAFLSALVGLTEEGQGILELYGEQLPGDIANLAALASILNENVGTIEELVEQFPVIAEGINRAYQPSIDGLVLRATFTPTFVALLDAFRGILGIPVLPLPGGGP